MTYQFIDLVCERANEKDWCLIFDSGPYTDQRTIIWEYPLMTVPGEVTELEITFSPDGRIVCAEKRRGDTARTRIDAVVSTDVCIEALELMAGPEFGSTDPMTGPLLAAYV